jgi:hypothetical protein
LGIAGGVADTLIAAMPLWQSVADEWVDVFRAAGDVAQAYEQEY